MIAHMMTKTCPTCRVEFETDNPRKRSCSDRCRKVRANRRYQRRMKLAYRAAKLEAK